MLNRILSPYVLPMIVLSMSVVCAEAAEKQTKPKPRSKFRWVNPLTRDDLPGLKHATFRSPSMKVDVGFCIYLPEAYKESEGSPKASAKRFPVVYYLHGGRPGSETKSVNLVKFVDAAIQAKTIPPTIYVFVNGGPVSHYNMPNRDNAMGEDVFIKELIPHIDATYRTRGERSGRAIEGFSQGGRGTSRIMFKHPHLFCSAAPGGGGYATEKRISEEGGKESETLIFSEGYNTWDLARAYAKRESKPELNILFFVGDKGFNYENNLEYMKFLTSLEIPYEKVIVADAPHSATKIYEKQGDVIMKFHAKNFARAE